MIYLRKMNGRVLKKNSSVCNKRNVAAIVHVFALDDEVLFEYSREHTAF